MSKAVLISMQPKWCELIASGKKTLEIRKTSPKLETPFKCYIYCTNSRNKYFLVKDDISTTISFIARKGGKVIGEFACGNIDTYGIAEDDLWFTYLIDDFQLEAACLSEEEFSKYGCHKTLFGWHISDLKIYDKPKEISEFVSCRKCEFDGLCGDVGISECGSIPVKRPPQSWCYVEELEGRQWMNT